MWGKARRSPGRQLLQEEVSRGLPGRPRWMQLRQKRKYDGAEGNQVPQGH